MNSRRVQKKGLIPRLDAERLLRNERSIFQRILYSQELRRKNLAKKAGLKYKIRSTAQQCCGMAAAWAHEALGLPRADAMRIAGVKSSAFKKYLRRRRSSISPKVNDVSLVKVRGRPRTYPIEVDAAFVLWLKNKRVPLFFKTMKQMKPHYRSMLREHGYPGRAKTITDKALERHIYYILKEKKWHLVTPKTLELKRCAVFDKMVEWFKKPEVIDLLTHVDPRLLFNADETEINRKSQARDKVVKVAKNFVTVPRKSPDGDHVSLFLIISASRTLVRPCAIIHAEQDRNGMYADTWLDADKVKLYHTEDGYMQQSTFYQIMKEDFIPYVERKRMEIHQPEKLAALVVDGHISRFFLDSLELLHNHNIALLVLPSNSSHVLQPLDLGLNNLIKARFREEYEKARPVIPFKDDSPKTSKKKAVQEGPRKRGRPPGRKNRKNTRSLSEPADENAVQEPPRKRGRPPGRKNGKNTRCSSESADRMTQTSVPEQACEDEDDSTRQPTTQQVSSPQQLLSQQPASPSANENRRVSLAYQEETSATITRVNKSGYRRARIIEAILNALPLALIPRNIRAAWETSHLFPFKPEPPGSKEDEELILAQLTEEDKELMKPTTKRKKFIYRTGIVTFGSTYEELKAELSGKAPQTVEVTPVTVTLNSSRGPVTGDFYADVNQIDATDCLPVPGHPNTIRPLSSGAYVLEEHDKDYFSD